MSLPRLAPEEFDRIFQSIHNEAPFPWQARLAARLAGGEGWPAVLGLPTGTGKTAALDVALFHLALEAGHGAERKAPMRIACVVDRRIVVDAAAVRAGKIARALADARGDGPLARMAARLAHLAGPGASPLTVATMRGGLPREEEWARSPGQPAILCSTVDQVGSRLLFRGYGISDSMKPVHAGLLGADCLLLLDEAHLSAPFAETLERVARYRRPPWCEIEPGPWGVVSLSATPGSMQPAFRLDAADLAHPVLQRRLGAAKPARLIALPLASRDERRQQPQAPQVEAFAEHAKELLRETGARTLAVVVNRVALARGVFNELMRDLKDEADVELLTGRIREHDRAALTGRLGPKLISGAARLEGERPLVVVATQTIEAGADFDFDAMMTQVAPLDSLRQRFGRLNRMGRDIPARAVILAARDEVTAKADDPVYGDRASRSWAWLQSIARQGEQRSDPIVDFGIEALERHLAGAPLADLIAPRGSAPLLRPADLLLLSWTSPVPAVDPDIAPFLHGPRAGPADVQIVWRKDISRADLNTGAEHLCELLDLAPPHSGEVLPVPLWAARAWLAEDGMAAAAVTDVEGAPAPERREEGGRPAFRWVGPDSPATGIVRPSAIRPGDVLVVPASYGGCDAHGWNPERWDMVTDLGNEVPANARRLRHRLHPLLYDDKAMAKRVSAALADDGRDSREVLEAALDLLDAERRGEREGWSLHRIDGYGGAVLRKLRPAAGSAPEAATESDAELAVPDKVVGLDGHMAAVAQQARGFAAAAGLPPERASDIALAAELHDLGKADRRFQLLLHGGDRFAALAAHAPLAKSRVEMTPKQRAAAARAAGLPERWRHEARSVSCAVADPRLAEAADRALVLWLIGTHHGHGRPLFPHHDPREPALQPGPQRLDFMFDGDDWPQLFERLKARYGAWELARMEAVVRLADHRASAEVAR